MKSAYDPSFYSQQKDISHRAAEIILPLIHPILQPKSVVDLGCGVGGWLAVWKHLGVKKVLGVDGGGMDLEQLAIPIECFQPHDLTKPLCLPNQFDLAMSLEVAEHLPPEFGPQFVATLTSLAPVVLFSAAIPFQGGTLHLNEQWPEYWATLFKQRGYRAVDYIRPRVWNDARVAYQYAQNAFLFLNEKVLPAYPELAREAERTNPDALACVHPMKWLKLNHPENFSLPKAYNIFVRSVAGFIRRRTSWRSVERNRRSL